MLRMSWRMGVCLCVALSLARSHLCRWLCRSGGRAAGCSAGFSVSSIRCCRPRSPPAAGGRYTRRPGATAATAAAHCSTTRWGARVGLAVAAAAAAVAMRTTRLSLLMHYPHRCPLTFCVLSFSHSLSRRPFLSPCPPPLSLPCYPRFIPRCVRLLCYNGTDVCTCACPSVSLALCPCVRVYRWVCVCVVVV